MVDELTEEQLAKFNQVFMLFDKKKEGFILTKDLGTALRTLGQFPTEAELDEIVADINKYNAGKVEFLAFVGLAVPKMNETITEDELREAFKVLDQEGTGAIPVADLQEFLTSFGEKLTEQEISEMIKQGDILEEGVINYAEFIVRMNEPPPPPKKKSKKKKK